MLDPVRKAQVVDFLRRVDAAYLGLQRHSVFRYGVSPTKLNDYMLAARPVIYAVEAPDDVVAESGAGRRAGSSLPTTCDGRWRCWPT